MPLVIRTTGLDEYLDDSGGAWIKLLLMGDAGTGKTPFAAQWPKPIFADCENGLASVAKLKVPYAPIQTSADMDALMLHLKQDSLRPPESRKYQTLVIDTFDSFQRKLIQERLKSERKETFSGHGDWGWLEGKMNKFVEDVLALKMNVVVNLHVKDVEDGDEDSKIQVKRAKLKGDIKDSIWQDFDLIGLMEKTYVAEGGERVLKRQIRWHSEPRFPTLRDRFNVLPRFTDVTFAPSDYESIFSLIAASLDDVPESGEVETLEVQGDGDVAPADVQGGPIPGADLPKPAAKRTAAKKTAAKKAAAPKSAPEPAPAPATPVAEEAPAASAEDPWTPPANVEPTPEGEPTLQEQIAASKAAEKPAEETPAEPTADDAEALLAQELGAEAIAEELAAPEPPKAEQPKSAPAASATKAPALCGDQPASFVGKHEAVPGCGRELSKENATRSQISMIRLKTWLCDECHTAHLEA